MPASPKKTEAAKTTKPANNVTPIAAKSNGVHKPEQPIAVHDSKPVQPMILKKEAVSTPTYAVVLSARVKKELDKWLSKRTAWNHNDWLSLLASLEVETACGLTSSQAGRDVIGLYLEQNRSKAQR